MYNGISNVRDICLYVTSVRCW